MLNAMTFVRGDRRYRHLLNCYDLGNLFDILFGRTVRRRSPGEMKKIREGMEFRGPAPRNGGHAELARLRRMRKLPPFLCRF